MLMAISVCAHALTQVIRLNNIVFFVLLKETTMSMCRDTLGGDGMSLGRVQYVSKWSHVGKPA